MYILTSSQIYRPFNNFNQSLAGRISIIHMLPLSKDEIISRDEIPFTSFSKEEINNKHYLIPFFHLIYIPY